MTGMHFAHASYERSLWPANASIACMQAILRELRALCRTQDKRCISIIRIVIRIILFIITIVTRLFQPLGLGALQQPLTEFLSSLLCLSVSKHYVKDEMEASGGEAHLKLDMVLEPGWHGDVIGQICGRIWAM